MMVVTPNRAQTLVFSGNGTQFSDNQFSIINNATESRRRSRDLAGHDRELRGFARQLHRLCCRAHGQTWLASPPESIGVVALNSGVTFAGQADVPAVQYSIAINNGGNTGCLALARARITPIRSR
jgi:hypothetical protein